VHTAANSSAEQHGKLRVARPVQASYVLCKPGSLILHGAEVFPSTAAHSSAQRTSAHSSAQHTAANSIAEQHGSHFRIF